LSITTDYYFLLARQAGQNKFLTAGICRVANFSQQGIRLRRTSFYYSRALSFRAVVDWMYGSAAACRKRAVLTVALSHTLIAKLL
jgi:hypothetical protein